MDAGLLLRKLLTISLSNFMPTSSLISVICSTYNRSDALSAALSGLLRQTDTNFEVIVADDGSTEETRFVIDSYIKKLLFEYITPGMRT